MLYLAALCPELGFTLEGVALTNLKKSFNQGSHEAKYMNRGMLCYAGN